MQKMDVGKLQMRVPAPRAEVNPVKKSLGSTQFSGILRWNLTGCYDRMMV